ncbi:hypothetical protein AWM75_02675 [Aerococcus urinaehominis]|uniref:Luciferase-like domain-containing protein n=1 Tax=Aerococcus urinaehominis TaxID=128944 RepID=A0A0X8FKL7_9LACT|nr:MsnO8 family LLM class oxidoreductase [Aerococcus urinaehominis]AMB98967.1 hypothetical protein AWM75_02675 [Aerococcus urinaehominis]SDM37162.1 luciferase family oxidoreductase, group 1 [Aerococcus urinaehominis]
MSSKIGILDFIPRDKYTSDFEAFQNTIKLAQHADELGLQRYWVAEHHNTPSILGNSPLILMARLASITKEIKVGAGGVMLDNTSPYQLAENMKTFSAILPGRIEMGVGHSTPTELEAQDELGLNIRHNLDYEAELRQLVAYSDANFALNGQRNASPIAMPVIHEDSMPLYLLSASAKRAQFCGEMGLGFNFGLFLNNNLDEAKQAIQIYRDYFRPSIFLSQPEATLSLFAVSAYNEDLIPILEHALDYWLMAFLTDKRSVYSLLSPDDAADYPFSKEEQAFVADFTYRKVVGDPLTIEKQLKALMTETKCDNFLIGNMLSTLPARRNLLEILAQIKL